MNTRINAGETKKITIEFPNSPLDFSLSDISVTGGTVSNLQLDTNSTEFSNATRDGTPSGWPNNSPYNEQPAQAFDNKSSTKWLIFARNGWLQYEMPYPFVATYYNLASANDVPERDPYNWVLQGSNNGSTFYNIDYVNGEDFPNRYQYKTYSVDSPDAYKYYRLRIDQNSGGAETQLSVFQLFGPKRYTVDFTANTGTETEAKIEVDGFYRLSNGYSGSDFVVDTFDINQPITISSSGTVSVDENTNDVITTVIANDPNTEDIISYSISGGSDGNLFSIDSETGELTFNEPPNYENPSDSGADNTYEIEVTASNTYSSKTQNLSISVNDVNELSFDTKNLLRIDENTIDVTTVVANDPDSNEAVNYSISGGSDRNLFDIDSETGVLTLNNAPDYENPGDSNADNTYEIEVTASYGTTTNTQTIFVTVDDVNESFNIISSDTVQLDENTAQVTVVAAEDPDGDVLTYSIGSGGDSSLFSIDRNSGELVFNEPPDFDNPSDSNSDNTYEVEVLVSDGGFNETQNISVTVNDINELLVEPTNTIYVSGSDNEIFTVIAEDPEGDVLTYSISGGSDSSLFSLDSSSGELIFNTPPNYANPSDSNSDNIYELEVLISDGNLSKTQSISAIVSNNNYLLTPVIDIDDSQNVIAGNLFNKPSVGITASSSNINNYPITYSLSDDLNGTFAINSDTGVVTLANPPSNYSANGEYSITVKASNGFNTISNDFVITADTSSILSSIIDETRIITVANAFASNIEEFEIIDLKTETTGDLTKILGYTLDVSNVSKETAVDLLDSLSLPDFISRFLSEVTDDLQLLLTNNLVNSPTGDPTSSSVSNSITLNYLNTLRVDVILESIVAALGASIDLPTFAIRNPGFTISNESGELDYKLFIPDIDPEDFLFPIIDSIGIEIPQAIKNELSAINTVGLALTSDGMLLNYQDEFVIDLGELFNFGDSIPVIEDIIDSVINFIFGSEQLVIDTEQELGVFNRNNTTNFYLKSLLNGNEFLLNFTGADNSASVKLAEIDLGFLGIDIFDGIKINQAQLFLSTNGQEPDSDSEAEQLDDEFDLVAGVNLIGAMDFTKSESLVGSFINNVLKIDSVSAQLAISSDSGLSLSGKANLNLPLFPLPNITLPPPIDDFRLTLKNILLGVDANFSEQEFGFTAGGGITLEGYDPFQANEPLLNLKGGLDLSYNLITQATTFGGFYSLQAGQTWTNVFGISDTEVRNFALELAGTIQPAVPSPLLIPNLLGFITDFRWKTINIDLRTKVDFEDPKNIAGIFTIYQPIGLSELLVGPVSPFLELATVDTTVIDDTADFLDELFKGKIASYDSDGDGKIDPLVQFVPFKTDIAGIPLDRGLGINAEFSGYGDSETLLSLRTNNTFTSLTGKVVIPEISFAIGNQPLLTLSGYQDDTLNLDLKASFSDAYIKGDGRLEIFGQTVAKADFSIDPSRIDIRDLDLNLFIINLDIDDFFLDTTTFDGGGQVKLNLFGQNIADASFSIDNGTKYNLDIRQLGFGNLLALRNVDLDLDFANSTASGAGSVILLGQQIQSGSFSVDSSGTNLNLNTNIDAGLASISSNIALGIDRYGQFDLNADSRMSLGNIRLDLGWISKSTGSLDFGAKLNFSQSSRNRNQLYGSIDDVNFSVFGRGVNFSSLGSVYIDGWDDIADKVYYSARDKAYSIAKGIFQKPVKKVVKKVSNTISRGWSKWQGYVDGAQVWLDVNNDGSFDPDEPNGITNVDGSLTLEVSQDINLSQSVIRSIGGIDTATGLPIVGVMSAPGNANITPLTSLIQGLIDNGATLAEATANISTALGISENVDLLNFNFVDEALNGNAEARNVLLGSNTVYGIISGTLNLLAGAAGGTIDSQNANANLLLSNAVYSSLAEFVNGNTFNIEDLEDSTQLEGVIRSAATTAQTQAQQQGVTLGIDSTVIDNVANNAAAVLAAGATKKRLLSEESADGIDLFTRITQAKFVANGEEATALNNFALGNVSEADIQALADTSETALQAIRNVDLNPQLAGIPDLYLIGDQDMIDLPITLFDFETAYEDLIITVTSDNQTLLPDANISIAAGSSPQEALFSVAPVDGETGEAAVTITVEDSVGNSLSEDITVTVETDVAPVFLEVPETTVITPRDTKLGTIIADLDADDGNARDTDLSVSYSILEGNNLDGDDLEPFAINLDGEIVVNDMDDLALADPITPFNLTIEANDGTFTTQTEVAIRVNDAPTVANSIADRSIQVGQSLNFQFAADSFVDINQDNLTYTATLADGSDLPAWLDFNPDTRTFSSNTNLENEDVGVFEIEVTASDGESSVSDLLELAVIETAIDDSTEQEGSDDNDAIGGGAGKDTVRGGNGDDVISGNDGSDRIFGDKGRDRLIGGEGNDRLDGGDDDDNLSGGAGRDNLQAGTGNDTLYGGAGNDRLFADAGDDFLDGGAGIDYLKGGAGNDTLYGGTGGDRLRGDAGNDVFVLTFGDTDNVIFDYQDGSDTLSLELSSFTNNTVEDIFTNELIISQNAGNTEIYADGNELLASLSNVAPSSLTVEDFTGF